MNSATAALYSLRPRVVGPRPVGAQAAGRRRVDVRTGFQQRVGLALERRGARIDRRPQVPLLVVAGHDSLERALVGKAAQERLKHGTVTAVLLPHGDVHDLVAQHALQLLFVTADRRVQDDDVAVGGPFEPEVLRDQRPDLGEARLPSKRRRRQPAREVARVDVTIPIEQSGIGFEIRVRAQQFFRADRVARRGR